jgi:hypothetical protein
VSLELTNSALAAERFFRLYHQHCTASDEDTLFNLLNATHSLHDRLLRSIGEGFLGIDEFIGLKALRNLFHHKRELVHAVKAIPITGDMPIYSDLALMCLSPRDLALQAIEEDRYAENRPRIEAVLKWYGEVVDINPAIFNFAVHAYEKLRALEIPLKGDAVAAFEASYQFEEDHGHSHLVKGNIVCRAGDVDAVLQAIYSGKAVPGE